MKRTLLVLAGLLLFGLARLPFERQLKRDYRAAHFLESELNADVRERAGQMGFVAALSGFRSVVADFLWLEAFSAWQDTAWGRMKFLFDAVTRLQPRSVLFWDLSAWHMAWNASRAMLDDPSKREALRIKASREYIRLGEDFALRGVQFNPDRAKLWERLGDLYRDKMNDPCKAAWAYFEAANRPDVMSYVHRLAVYQLGKCPGHEAETYRLTRALYNRGPNERLPSLLKLLDELQTKLNISAAERIDIRKDLEEATPRIKK